MTVSDTIDDVKVGLNNWVLSEVQKAYDEYQAAPKIEAAGPQDWWDIYLIGPFQPDATTLPPGPMSGPLLPHRIIRAGDPFYFTTVLYLNPNYPAGLPACDLLASMACSYEINYYSGSLQSWSPAPYHTTVSGTFSTAHGCFYENTVGFLAQQPDLIEMNVTARILNCNDVTLPHFGGFATAVYQFYSGIFGPGEGFDYNVGSRFLITG